MAATNTPIPDLVELSGITQTSTYTPDGAFGGRIFGVVDDATYSDGDHSNTATEINELNETYSANGGTLTIGGQDYNIQLVSPERSDTGAVGVQLADGSSRTILGDGDDSAVVFIEAEPVGGGSTRFFALFDDSLGDLSGITTITTGTMEWDPPGDDVMIRAGADNDVSPVCFASGTGIATPQGERAVETLRRGDIVTTLDHGPQPIIWTGSFRLDAAALHRHPHLRPVLIRRGALGNGLPRRDLRVSPQHRVLVRSRVATRLFGKPEILVPAIKLRDMRGIGQPRCHGGVSYHHFLCRRHEIVEAEGLPAESLLHARQALRQLRAASAVPSLWLLAKGARTPARPIRERRDMLATLLRCHAEEGRPLLEQVGT